MTKEGRIQTEQDTEFDNKVARSLQASPVGSQERKTSDECGGWGGGEASTPAIWEDDCMQLLFMQKRQPGSTHDASGNMVISHLRFLNLCVLLSYLSITP